MVGIGGGWVTEGAEGDGWRVDRSGEAKRERIKRGKNEGIWSEEGGEQGKKKSREGGGVGKEEE